MKMAFQKRGQTGVMRVVGALGAWLDRGPYRHTEIVTPDGMCWTSEAPHGVVARVRDMDPADWDFVDLPPELEPRVRAWYGRYMGRSYDYWGNVRFVFGAASQSEHKWFCTESNLAALGVPEPWRFGPSGAYSLVRYVWGQK